MRRDLDEGVYARPDFYRDELVEVSMAGGGVALVRVSKGSGAWQKQGSETKLPFLFHAQAKNWLRQVLHIVQKDREDAAAERLARYVKTGHISIARIAREHIGYVTGDFNLGRWAAAWPWDSEGRREILAL